MEIGYKLAKKLTIILRKEKLLDPVTIKTKVTMVGAITFDITTEILTDEDFIESKYSGRLEESSVEGINRAVVTAWEKAIREFVTRGEKK